MHGTTAASGDHGSFDQLGKYLICNNDKSRLKELEEILDSCMFDLLPKTSKTATYQVRHSEN
jgi:hypothetical protein